MDLPILYEDPDIVVINKPAGLIVHSDGKTDEPTVADWVREKYPSAAKVGEPLVHGDGRVIRRSGIVHRLDRETSGSLIIAKTPDGYQALKRQFQAHTVEKTYLAFLYGELKESEGVIERPIGRSRGDFRKWSAERGTRGALRAALTGYRVLERGGGFSLAEVTPRTGRTHQIRVHLKAISYPVVCDKLYAPKRPCALGFSRLALHASGIRFKNAGGDVISVSAPEPADFLAAKELLKKASVAEER